MIDHITLQKIKRLTISALVSDEMLMGILVLKGGNALGLAYDITSRGSIDIDFSMERDFTEPEKQRILNQINQILYNEFSREGLIPFDIHFVDKPRKIEESIQSFWGGYLLEFKIIEKERFELHNGNLDQIRRNALPIHTDNSTKFTVDISKYEYVTEKRTKDIEGAAVYVYTPEMLAFEKLRAICQQIPEYRTVIKSMTQRSRARDFYDIFNLATTFGIDFGKPENILLCRNIFHAKRVPVNYIDRIGDFREFHRLGWDSVVDTVNRKESLQDFDFYFDFLIDKISPLCQSPLG